MNEKLKEKISESLSSVMPITVIVLLLSVTLVPLENGTWTLFLCGAALLIVGMGFFQLGAEMAMTPLGQGVGGRLIKSCRIPVMLLAAFGMGVLITIAEPDQVYFSGKSLSLDYEKTSDLGLTVKSSLRDIHYHDGDFTWSIRSLTEGVSADGIGTIVDNRLHTAAKASQTRKAVIFRG